MPRGRSSSSSSSMERSSSGRSSSRDASDRFKPSESSSGNEFDAMKMARLENGKLGRKTRKINEGGGDGSIVNRGGIIGKENTAVDRDIRDNEGTVNEDGKPQLTERGLMDEVIRMYRMRKRDGGKTNQSEGNDRGQNDGYEADDEEYRQLVRRGRSGTLEDEADSSDDEGENIQQREEEDRMLIAQPRGRESTPNVDETSSTDFTDDEGISRRSDAEGYETPLTSDEERPGRLQRRQGEVGEDEGSNATEDEGRPNRLQKRRSKENKKENKGDKEDEDDDEKEDNRYNKQMTALMAAQGIPSVFDAGFMGKVADEAVSDAE